MMVLAKHYRTSELAAMTARQLAERAGVSTRSARRFRHEVVAQAERSEAVPCQYDTDRSPAGGQKHYSTTVSAPHEVEAVLAAATLAVRAVRVGATPTLFAAPADDLEEHLVAALSALGPAATFMISVPTPERLNAVTTTLAADPATLFYGLHSPYDDPTNLHVHAVSRSRAARRLYGDLRAYGVITTAFDAAGYAYYLAGHRPGHDRAGRPYDPYSNGPVGPITFGPSVPLAARAVWAVLSLWSRLYRLPYPQLPLLLAAGRVEHGCPTRRQGTPDHPRVLLAERLLAREVAAVRAHGLAAPLEPGGMSLSPVHSYFSALKYLPTLTRLFAGVRNAALRASPGPPPQPYLQDGPAERRVRCSPTAPSR